MEDITTVERMEQEQLTWRKLLGRIVSTPAEKQQLADVLGINTITLTRWTSTRSKSVDEAEQRPRPRAHLLRQLVDALPNYREQLIPLIQEEFPDFLVEEPLASLQANEAKEIPANFYAKVLSTAATLGRALRYLTVFDLLLVHATQQLDPERLGLSIIVVQCVPPSPPDEKVFSLHEQFRIGTPPWSPEREEKTLFLGAESLAGHAVTTGKPEVIDDVRSYSGLLPVHQSQYEVSVAAYPLQRAGRIAGCLLVSSTQLRYFTRPRQELLQAYSDLAVVAFYDHECYEPDQIELRLMPDEMIQGPHLFMFNKRVEDLLRDGRMTSRLEAEQKVLKQLESELIYWYATKGPVK